MFIACVWRPLGLVTLLSIAAPIGAFASAVSGQGTWESTLQGRDLDGNVANGFEAYYDTDLDITWLADARYATTSGYDRDGYMNWDEAKAWAAQLNINGTTGWRLPGVKPVNGSSFDYNYSPAGNTDVGFNITSSQSELAHLYHVTLGSTSYYDASGNGQPDFGMQNSGPFRNVQPYAHWSGVEYAPGTGYAWAFGTDNGFQGWGDNRDEFSVWAVRPGDVAAVPEPSTYALMMIGIAGIGLATCRKS